LDDNPGSVVAVRDADAGLVRLWSGVLPDQEAAEVKKQRPIVLKIEKRPLAGYEKESRQRVDAYALVEERSGLTVRWSLDRRVLERELARGVRYY
jgi:hypothetical protein